ncbi:HD domain-containing protein [Nocardia sp. NEAU-G5]|uniref:HD domain-containing protein n=1 Tax=Nocardia albiluteola TaxID=2842303 RepID=A0ABS6AYM4_9NOCA|nr:HD domain-containing protein [Nocardia albiluteola]
MAVSSWAWQLAESQLAQSLPRRWAHSQGVARAVETLEPSAAGDADLLVASALLHDIGYAPAIVMTGFHPLDGARFLRDEHQADDRLVRLVANHTFAVLEAEERGLRAELEAEFPILEDQFLVDALMYADMTTTPDGEPTTPAARIAEIVDRYGPDTVVGRFIQRAEPEILAATARIDRLLAAHPR